MQKAAHQLSNGKASGAAVIPAESYLKGGNKYPQQATHLFQQMWTQGKIP